MFWVLVLVFAIIFSSKEFDLPGGIPYWSGEFSVYDLDAEGLAERIDLLFQEVIDLFGSEIDGLVVELEFCDGEAKHRIPTYNEWASNHNRPDYTTIKAIRLEPRAYPYSHWRDFTTWRRIETLKRIETVVRDRGFTGELASIVELDNQPTVVMGNVNLEMLYKALPHWAVVTYDSIYDRRRNRLATVDFCIQQPRDIGFNTYYLTRNVMTFGIPADLPPTDLEEQWRLSLEDAAVYQPDALWFMGSDCRYDSLVCRNAKLTEWGFSDGRAARTKLFQMAKILLGK